MDRDCNIYSEGSLMRSMCQHDDKTIYTNFNRMLNNVPNNIYLRKDVADGLRAIIGCYREESLMLNIVLKSNIGKLYGIFEEYTKDGQELISGPDGGMREFKGITKDDNGDYVMEYSEYYTKTYYYPKPFSLVELISIINDMWKIKKKYNFIIKGFTKFINYIKKFHLFTLFRCQNNKGQPSECFI